MDRPSMTARFLTGASQPGSAMWRVLAAIGVGTAWSALTDGALVVEGLVSAAVVLGVMSVLKQTFGWPIWPWWTGPGTAPAIDRGGSDA